jgi:hypothetical protein
MVLKLATAATGSVMSPVPVKSARGVYGEREAFAVAVTPRSVLPEVPAKSSVPS